MGMRLAFLLALGLALPACSVLPPTGQVIPEPPAAWRAIATENDRERLREWRSAFVSALEAARADGHGDDIAREGALLDPDAAIADGGIPNGLYRCRVIKLGAQSEGLLDYVAYPYFSCRVAQQGEVQSFTKLTGSQRQMGLIFPHDALRRVFLGTLVLGDETQAMQYGQDRERDVAAWVERIGPDRWRMVMPQPRFESQLDVLELVPAE
jgi:hypothetical protein